jgi:hypothetical protein
MTPTDIEDGGVICEIGIAPSHPAEFVIFRILQRPHLPDRLHSELFHDHARGRLDSVARTPPASKGPG